MTSMRVKDCRGTLSERLERNLIPEPNTGCFLWLGAMRGRYGIINVHPARTTKVHRVAYQLAKGKIPDGLHVCHRCDVPTCCNPDHLFVGTHTDNMRDMFRKGRRRTAVGAASGQSKLTESQVREIFAAHGTQKSIATRYGISQVHVGDIKNRKIWKHLNLEGTA